MNEIQVSDDSLTLQDWTWGSFLRNRENKASLVLYLSKKILTVRNRLCNNETLYVSFQGKFFEVNDKINVINKIIEREE